MLPTNVVASRLNVCRRTVQRLCADGEIGAIRVGHQWRVPEDALEAYLRRGGSGPDYTIGEAKTDPDVMVRRQSRH